MTTPDYVSSVSLLPTVDFMEYVARKQWGSGLDYVLGLSEIIPTFHSTTNSEWVCLNSESEFLESPLGTFPVKNPFSYTRPESSPVFVALNDISIPKNKVRNAKSLFLYRIADNGLEVITVTNYAKQDVTTAPLIDCFSRECLTWFSSSVDWFSGFGYSSQSLTPFVVNDDGIILTKSEEILSSLIIDSVAKIDHTNIQLVNTVSGSTLYASIQLSTGVQYTGTGTDKANSLFLYSVDKDDDSLVAFACGYPTPFSSVSYDRIVTDISFSSEDVLII
jgi:hypothetical protein